MRYLTGLSFRFFILLSIPFVALLFVGCCFAQTPIEVNDKAARGEIHDDAILVDLTVENIARAALPANILTELLEPHGATQAHVEQKTSLLPGTNKLRIALPLPVLRSPTRNPLDFLWHRLRFTITPEQLGGAPAKPTVEIISVGQITRDLFELHVAEPQFVRETGHYAVRVRAIRPISGRAIAGVTLQAALDLDRDDNQPLLTKPASTDGRGFATLEFTLPDTVDTDQIDVTVTGKLGNFSNSADGSLRVIHFSTVTVSTDKPLYQPGQTLHSRLMAFDPNKKAISDQPVVLKILDPEETLVYRTEVRTSRFGIASADWQIPDNLRLGTYRIQANFGEGRYEDSGASASVKISRYDLPAFSVTVKPDRTFYLPGQNATTEVRADYLYGEAVQRGHVRVVRESERKWNYREQKWDIEEGAVYEGDTDEQGRYLAKVDLHQEQEQLLSEDYRRFRDITYAAYFTDSSTGRTEQRRFDLRLSKDPIHIYVIQSNEAPAKGLPLEFYLSTDYADGSPAQCDLQINLVTDEEKATATDSSSAPVLPLRRVRTNRYGVAKVSGLAIPNERESNNFELSFHARDRKGLEGHHTEAMWYSDRSGIRVASDKTLYKQGEAIEVDLQSAQPDLTVVVEAVHDLQTISSRLVHLRHGRGSVTFDADERFQNEISLLAYAFGSRSDYGFDYPEVMGWHGVYFPKDHELKVDVRLAKSTFRPGDEANAELHVSSADGSQGQTALGLVVVDKAVEERERTDRDFSGPGGFYNFRQYWTSEAQINGVRKSDLDKLDLSRPLPDGLELVAEILVQGDAQYPEMFSSDSERTDFRNLFATEIDPPMTEIRNTLSAHYERTDEYPKTQTALEQTLAAKGDSFAAFKDPWGMPYQARFSVVRASDVLQIVSAGPDKIFGTEDDFVAAGMEWPYFKSKESAIRSAVREYHTRTGGFIRDAQTLKAELARADIDTDTWKDPWGHAYQFSFGVNQSQYTITANSAGPDGRFATKTMRSDDDFSLASVGIDYFADWRAKMDAALASYFKETQSFPEDFGQFQQALAKAGIPWNDLRDPWGHPYYVAFRQESRYVDSLTIQTYEEHQKAAEKAQLVPVVQQINWLQIRSAGEDQTEGTADDFAVAVFSRGIAEQRATDKTPMATKEQVPLLGSTGAISGTITDPSGAAIACASATAKNNFTGQEFTAKTNDDGVYLLRNVPAGLYSVQFSALGFRAYTVTNVPVQSSNLTKLDASLNVGQMTETVEVSAGAVLLQTMQSVTVAALPQSGVASLALPPQLATPRLREYFPETLFWQPELVTDEKGRAHLKFPLADNITTWKLSAVASTVDGNMGTAEKEIRTFQPFLVELDPPRFLTVGDEIALPVVLRNYLDRRLQLNVQMKPASWFKTTGSMTQQTAVPPRDSARDIFRFHALNATPEGKQEVSAIGPDASDAISKPVTVRPDGEEKTESVSDVFTNNTSLSVTVPETAISGSIKTSLKIYPNLTAHVLESIEAILERPYGCGEQTISSTYPSVLLSKYAKGSAYEKSPTVLRARRYAELGYQRLLSYRTASGGFSYWGRGDADLALTVYAIKFLSDAREFVALDDSVIQEALTWVVNQGKPDGHWAAMNWQNEENLRQSTMLTAYIARVLATSLPTSGVQPNSPLGKSAASSLAHALAYLRPQMDEFDEPYAISSYALAALAAGDNAEFSRSVAKLMRLARREGDASYWSLETNTPFYGWGLAGRVETTALVLRVLAQAQKTDESDALLRRGLLFLLHNQDRYGIWYSTQATVTVLDTMASLISRDNAARDPAQRKDTIAKAAIFVDGHEALSIDLPPAGVLTAPLNADLSMFVTPGQHQIAIRRTGELSPTSVQLLEDHYVPWTHAATDSTLRTGANMPDALHLSVHFDKTSGTVGESVRCSVTAERVGFRGYGMLLGEIGLPPGAEIDRASLDEAVKNSGWDINQFDVLPDRLIVYLWPRAGGTQFSFTFKPRFGLNALTTPSLLYDYYNPEAHAVLEPIRFTVQ